MSEQWAWIPAENKTDIRCSCESTDCSKALIVAYDEIQIYDVHMGGGLSFMLPDDVRLCRRVPATSQVAPSVSAMQQYLRGAEVIVATRQEWDQRYCDGWQDGHDDALGGS